MVEWSSRTPATNRSTQDGSVSVFLANDVTDSGKCTYESAMAKSSSLVLLTIGIIGLTWTAINFDTKVASDDALFFELLEHFVRSSVSKQGMVNAFVHVVDGALVARSTLVVWSITLGTKCSRFIHADPGITGVTKSLESHASVVFKVIEDSGAEPTSVLILEFDRLNPSGQWQRQSNGFRALDELGYHILTRSQWYKVQLADAPASWVTRLTLR